MKSLVTTLIFSSGNCFLNFQEQRMDWGRRTFKKEGANAELCLAATRVTVDEAEGKRC